MIIFRSIHVAANGIISLFFFLQLGNIPLCIYIYIYLYTFRFHLSVNKHLGCFHVLAIVNSATINTGVLESFQLFPVIGAGLLKIPMAKWWNESGLEESDLGSNPRE